MTTDLVIVKGKKGLLSVRTSFSKKESPMKFWVKVLGVEKSFGRTRYRVEPISGTGIALVENVTFEK